MGHRDPEQDNKSRAQASRGTHEQAYRVKNNLSNSKGQNPGFGEKVGRQVSKGQSYGENHIAGQRKGPREEG